MSTALTKAVALPPFQRLLDAHGADLHRFCVAQAGPDAGSDCFQEAIISALRSYPTVNDASNLRGWLFTIAHRKVIDHHRAASRRGSVICEVPDVGAPATVRDPDLWASVALLPRKQRAAIALRYLGDLPYVEIADALDCSEAAARQNVRAGLASLRQEVTR